MEKGATFKEIGTLDVVHLINEADTKQAFLPSVGDPKFSVERFLTQENFPGYKLFGIQDETGEMVGFISIKPKDENSIVIGPMYIAENARGRGFGKLQVEKLIDWAKENNIENISTKTWGENRGSRRIFEELGFTLIEEKPNARINGDSTVKYSKNIVKNH